jgi:hypothetical protein
LQIFNRYSESDRLNYLSYEWDKPLIYTVVPRKLYTSFFGVPVATIGVPVGVPVLSCSGALALFQQVL